MSELTPSTRNDASDVEHEILDVLSAVDVGGVLHETAAAAFATTRRSFLRRSVGAVAGVSALSALATATNAHAADASTKNDTAILQFDLALEYLQAGLYTEAERLGSFQPRRRLLGRASSGRTSARTYRRSKVCSARGRPFLARPSTTAT